MSELVFAVIVGIGFAFFATQNAGAVPLTFGSFQMSAVPLYVVVLGALLLGLILAWVIHMIGSIEAFAALKSKESKIRDSENALEKLKARVHELEVENARLKNPVYVPETPADEPEARIVTPEENIFSRIRRGILGTRFPTFSR